MGLKYVIRLYPRGKHCFTTTSRNFASAVHKNLRSKNYDVEKLVQMTPYQLAFKVIRLQQRLDSYQWLHDPISFDGREKIRIDHPDIDDIKTEPCSYRRVAFKLLYLGWNYTGYAWEDQSWGMKQIGHTNVVERVFLEALLRQQLISNIGSKRLKLERSGRTDRQVSGLSQVISIQVRSDIEKGFGVWRPVKDEDVQESNGLLSQNSKSIYFEEGFSIKDTSLDAGEIPYVSLLNEALPLDVRVLAWSPVRRNFSARYDCRSRTYRYVFPRGPLDIGLMQDAAARLEGTHDFRNFCSKSKENIFKHFTRSIQSFKIEEAEKSSKYPECDICVATITAVSFLQQQIRYMMCVLGLIGLKEQKPSYISDLLDIEKTPRKPGYTSFTGLNLTLVGTDYDDDDIHWRWDQKALLESAEVLAENYTMFSAKSEGLRHMYGHVCSKMTNQKRNDAAIAFTESLSETLLSGGLGFQTDASTIEEKRVTYNRREVNRLITKGSYYKAATMHRDMAESKENNTSDQSQEEHSR